MNPHELALSPTTKLSSFFCAVLIQKDIPSVHDVFVQIESRFHRLTTTAEGSQEFLDSFLSLAGQPEVRSLHLDDPLVRCVARLEYLLELAGERARPNPDEATLRQIVASRERGSDLLHVLAGAPDEGLTAGQLAERLDVTPQNLSPLIRTFHAHGVIDRSQQGKNAFVKLTAQGRALLVSSRPLVPTEEPVGKVLGEAVLEVVEHISHTPYLSKRSILGAAHHGLGIVEERHRDGEPKSAELVREMAEHLKQAMGVAS